MSARARRAWGVALLAAALVSGCGNAPSPTLAPTPTPTPPPTPPPTPTPVAYADTLRIGVNLGLSRSWQPMTELDVVPGLTFGRLVYSGLYRYDGRVNAIPELTDGPCFVPGDDGKVIRCRLIETTFHDGTPLTADDVAYTYEVMNRPPLASLGALTEVRVVDARTVDFVLSEADPTLLTQSLPQIPIFSRHSIDEAVTVFDEATKDLTAEGLDKLADTINDEINRDPPVCTEARLAEVDAIYGRLGYIDDPKAFLLPNGTSDTCGALGMGAFNLDTSTNYLGGSIGYALSQTGIDRVAGIVGQMAWGRPDIFVGTGPYRYVFQDGDAVHFEAWPGYHGGVAATKYVDFVRATDDGSDLVAGTVDIVANTSLGTAFEATAAAHGVQIVHPATGGYYYILFNLQPGRLFTDVNLRRALQLCIDLPRDVDAVTAGAAVPIYSPVLPGTEAYATDLPKPERDVAAAKRLIEASGWTLGSDGVYAKGKTRLATTFPVRLDDAWRVKMADLIATQARDCGFDLQTTGPSWEELLSSYDDPNAAPWGLALAGYPGGIDAGDGLGALASSKVTNSVNCTCANSGWSDPAYDKLVGDASVTYDQAERVRLYRQAQKELASQVPVVFLWRSISYDALRTAVATVDGPLDLTVPNWAWQPERLVVVNP